MKRIVHSRGAVTIEAYPEQARRVLRSLYEAYMEERLLYAHVVRSDAPQTRHLPESIVKGGEDHLRWLFFAALTDRRDASENVYAAHKRLYVRQPILYLDEVTVLTEGEIKKILVAEQVSMPGTSARNWVACADTLYGKFEGNPLRTYESGSIGGALLAKKKAPLPGYGAKLLSLLALFFHEVGALEKLPENTFPIDLHVQRIALATGIIRGEGNVRNDMLENVLRELFSQIAKEEGWDVLELAHALWFLGNRLCTGCNKSSKALHFCPIYEECRGAIPTRSYFKKGLWELNAQRLRKGGENQFRLPEDTPLFGEP